MLKNVMLSTALLGLLFIGCNKETNTIIPSLEVKCVQGPIDRAAICPTVYNPVCGCNDVTYSNSCRAEANGISNYVNGACKTSKSFSVISSSNDCVGKPLTDVNCTMVYDPVCGCNDVTYSNGCVASVAGVSNYTQGACNSKKSFTLKPSPNDCVGKPLTNVNCPMVYDPVCGCNDVTYSNGCVATVAGVSSYTQGACGTSNEM